MKSKSCQYNGDSFNLSREGAGLSGWGFEFTVDKHRPACQGISLITECSGNRLVFWIPEKEWCEWVSLQIPVSSFREMEKDFIAVIAEWVLSPLSTLLREHNLPEFGKVSAVSAGGPVHSCWRVNISRSNYFLPIYLKQVPDQWWLSVMTFMTPSTDLMHEFPLSLGWTLLERGQWKNVVAGDAISAVNVEDSLGCFCLCMDKEILQLSIQENGTRVVAKASSLLPNSITEDLHVIWIDAGVIRFSSSSLAGLGEGKIVSYDFMAYPGACLRINNRIVGQGDIIRFSNMWSVRLKTKSSKAGSTSRQFNNFL